LAVLGGGDVSSFLLLTGLLLLVGFLASIHFCHSRNVMAEGTICSHIDTPAQALEQQELFRYIIYHTNAQTLSASQCSRSPSIGFKMKPMLRGSSTID
jgi:hypothetical protein